MKPGTLTSKRLLLPVLALGIIVMLASWAQHQVPAGVQQSNPTDTLPKKKKVAKDRQPKDIDEVIAELDAVDLDVELKKVKEELSRAMKELDGQKLKLEMQQALEKVNFEKIQEELNKALKEIDPEKIKKEIEESVARIDANKIKAELEEVRKMDFSKMEAEMKAAMENIEKIKPDLEKQMENVKEELSSAKVQIEKAKADLKEMKSFIDDLDRDGLINKKEPYTIKHEDGELKINDKKVSAETYNKYRSFLEKHKEFKIKKTADDFDINLD